MPENVDAPSQSLHVRLLGFGWNPQLNPELDCGWMTQANHEFDYGWTPQ